MTESLRMVKLGPVGNSTVKSYFMEEGGMLIMFLKKVIEIIAFMTN